MFRQLIARWTAHYVANQINKYERLTLVHNSIDELEILIGEFGYGLDRLGDILTNEGTIEERVLNNATVRFNDAKDLVLRGIDNKTKTPFEMTINKQHISWHQTNHTHNMGLDTEYELCKNPNEGVLDIQLKNGESVILGYMLDKNKEFELIS